MESSSVVVLVGTYSVNVGPLNERSRYLTSWQDFILEQYANALKAFNLFLFFVSFIFSLKYMDGIMEVGQGQTASLIDTLYILMRPDLYQQK